MSKHNIGSKRLTEVVIRSVIPYCEGVRKYEYIGANKNAIALLPMFAIAIINVFLFNAFISV